MVHVMPQQLVINFIRCNFLSDQNRRVVVNLSLINFYSGKTSIYINTIINQNRNNYIKSVEGFGCKRVLGV